MSAFHGPVPLQTACRRQHPQMRSHLTSFHSFQRLSFAVGTLEFGPNSSLFRHHQRRISTVFSTALGTISALSKRRDCLRDRPTRFRSPEPHDLATEK